MITLRKCFRDLQNHSVVITGKNACSMWKHEIGCSPVDYYFPDSPILYPSAIHTWARMLCLIFIRIIFNKETKYDHVMPLIYSL